MNVFKLPISKKTDLQILEDSFPAVNSLGEPTVKVQIIDLIDTDYFAVNTDILSYPHYSSLVEGCPMIVISSSDVVQENIFP